MLFYVFLYMPSPIFIVSTPILYVATLFGVISPIRGFFQPLAPIQLFTRKSDRKFIKVNFYIHVILIESSSVIFIMLNDNHCKKITRFMVAVIITFATTCLTVVNSINQFLVFKFFRFSKLDLSDIKPQYQGIFRGLKTFQSSSLDENQIVFGFNNQTRKGYNICLFITPLRLPTAQCLV